MAPALRRPRDHGLLTRGEEIALHLFAAEDHLVLGGGVDDRGGLRHCTDANVDRQYVDSHGQSEVAFALCRLLGFELLPRLNAIQSQRLYRPAAGMGETRPRLVPVLTRPIDGALIRQQYDQLVKYTTALRLGTAKADAILRRFTRSNVQHPTYKALSELGKAVKTIRTNST